MPGASRSGFATRSWVGPWLENGATTSSETCAVPELSSAPTVTTNGSSPGFVIVPAPGPELPAATATKIPENHVCSTA
jgi:hypothetical protein